jgi:hypothetical protein
MTVDVATRLAALGARWDAERQVWIVPRERRDELHDLLTGLGLLPRRVA